MNVIMNGNQITIVKEFEIDKPVIHKSSFLIDKCIKECLSEYFHTIE